MAWVADGATVLSDPLSSMHDLAPPKKGNGALKGAGLGLVLVGALFLLGALAAGGARKGSGPAVSAVFAIVACVLIGAGVIAVVAGFTRGGAARPARRR
jgi:hypothetical protein